MEGGDSFVKATLKVLEIIQSVVTLQEERILIA